jgi:hypothetical protein
METTRTTKQRPGNKKKNIRSEPLPPITPIDHAVTLLDTVCLLAGSENLINERAADGRASELRSAIAAKDTAYLFGWLVEILSFQGISDRVARSFMDRHGSPSWSDLESSLGKRTLCPKLESYWSFADCRYVKGKMSCSMPEHFARCSLPRHKLRNGRLNQTAYALFLFIRDVAGGDLVGWIDGRIEQAYVAKNPASLERATECLVEPLSNVIGTGRKVLAMALSQILMAAPRTKKSWLEIGASIVVIDTLTHNLLVRTGILYRFGASHKYGRGCYEPNGCADIIHRASTRIDASRFNAHYPKCFPRFVQHAIWRFCAQQGFNICNGNTVNDEQRCAYRPCPLYCGCDRIRLHD